MRRIKRKALSLISYFLSILLRIKGVKVGKKCIILGKPNIYNRKGGHIILGNNVTLISHPRFNSVLERPIELKTLHAGASIHLADHSGISGCTLISDNKISIGEYTIVGPGTLILDVVGHEYSEEIGWGGRSSDISQSITIGKKCYIGTRCIILTGVTIGDNCVVSAGSVVDRSIPAGHFAAGNPVIIKPLPKLLGGVGKKRG